MDGRKRTSSERRDEGWTDLLLLGVESGSLVSSSRVEVVVLDTVQPTPARTEKQETNVSEEEGGETDKSQDDQKTDQISLTV